MSERFARAGDVELCYESFGDEADEPMLLIAGVGASMLSWDRDFCKMLAGEGYWVVRYDNRDSGHSTSFLEVPDLEAVVAGDTSSVPYSIDDLAKDAAGLMDALSIRAAHIVGMSMGAMVAQVLAVEFPTRLLSLVSIMSTTGAPGVGQPSGEAVAAIMAQPKDSSLEAAIEVAELRARAWGSPAYPRSAEQIREAVESRRKRGDPRGGALRHLAAILSAADRTKALSRISVPTLVVHGEADTLLDISGGEATSQAVKNSQLLTFPGMGHELPRPLWPDVVAAIAANARRV